MWNLIAHLPVPALGTAGILGLLGLCARPIFKYPHMWRYLESRHRSRDGHSRAVSQRKNRRQ